MASKGSDIRWRPDKVAIGDLKPWERNPRRISRDRAERLLESWKKFGQVQTVAVGPDNEVYDGHQRLSVLRAAHGPEYQVLVLRASRALTEAERENLVLALHAGAFGEWDWDALSEWDADALAAGGMDETFKQILRRDLKSLGKLLKKAGQQEGEEVYSRKIEPPVYEPTGRTVTVADLADRSKADELLAEIEAADVPEEEKEFLRLAAMRHIAFDYENIAEYYAQASESMKSLMEESALVVIDFDQAVAAGFVRMSNALADMYREEYGDDAA